MQISKAGLALVKEFEGCLKPVAGLQGNFRAYTCPAGVLTIGYGHTNHHGRQFNSGSVWSQAECDAELQSDMEHFERAVERLVKVELKQCQFDALVSFAYNCGEGNLSKSTLLRKINAKDFEGAAREFHKWNKGGGRVLSGLVRRRASESLLFQGIADENFDGKPDELIRIPFEEPLPQQVDPPEVKPLEKSTIDAGAKVGAGVAGTGILAMILEQVSAIPKSILDFIVQVGQKPYFWLALGSMGAFWYIHYRRKVMRDQEGL